MKLETNWLVSSQTVAKVQRFFGLEHLEPSDNTANQQNNVTCNGHLNGTTHTQNGRLCNTQPHGETQCKKQQPRYRVHNWFWYSLFAFGATLGDDVFYYTFYPFWFYNLSPWVIRRVILTWGLVMYVGQSSKEILRWPRPSDPPALRIEKRYFQEYGMPSTHAMVGTLVPFTILAVTWDHYEYNHTTGVILASLYTLLVCFSRLYRGMHYVLDILVGTGSCFLLLGLVLQILNPLDNFLLTHPFSPIVLVATTVFLCLIYPCKEGWSSTRNDTTMCLAVVSGAMTASWICYRLGWLVDAETPMVHPVIWPGWKSIGLMMLREIVGLAVMVVVHITSRALVLFLMSIILGRKIVRKPEAPNVVIEFPFKYISYYCIVCAMVLISPVTFTALGIPVYTFNLQ